MIPIVKENLERLASTDMSFKDLFGVISEKFHDEIFAEYIKDGRIISVTYDQMAAKVRRTAGAIYEKFGNAAADADADKTGGQNSGIIGIYMENSVEWVVLFWGCLKAGFKPLLLNTRQDTDITREIIDELEPAAVFSDNDRIEGCITYNDFMTDISDAEVDRWVNNILLVTSGSTKKPKIVVHNGKSICSQIQLTADILKKNITLRHNRKLEIRILAFLPFYHIFGLVTTMMWFTVFGRTLIFLQDYAPNTIQYTCQRMEVTHFFAVPLVWDTLVKKFMREVEKQDKMKTFERAMKISNSLQTVFPHIGPSIVRNTIFKSVRKQMLGMNLHFLISGGGFISDKTLEVMNALGYSLYVGYGLTECGILSVNLSRKAKRRLGASCGPVFSNVTYRINNDGELEIKSDNCFVGMYVDGQFVPNEADYYNTNDIVYFDENNELRIKGRTDDLIITENGENMSPEVIESKLDRSGFASVSAVYAMAEGKKQIILVVENDEGTTALKQAQALKALFDSIDELPLAEKPSMVVRIIGEVPHNLKGADRRKLTDGISSGELIYEKCDMPTGKDIEKYGSEEYIRILEAVKASFADVTKSEEEISDTSDFIRLGGDSMMYVELLEVISDKVGVRVGMPNKPLVTPVAFADYIINEIID